MLGLLFLTIVFLLFLVAPRVAAVDRRQWSTGALPPRHGSAPCGYTCVDDQTQDVVSTFDPGCSVACSARCDPLVCPHLTTSQAAVCSVHIPGDQVASEACPGGRTVVCTGVDYLAGDCEEPNCGWTCASTPSSACQPPPPEVANPPAGVTCTFACEPACVYVEPTPGGDEEGGDEEPTPASA